MSPTTPIASMYGCGQRHRSGAWTQSDRSDVAVARYSYKTVSVHGTFKWPSSFLYNLRIDCGSQDYR